mgnify:CR=1 FL=1
MIGFRGLLELLLGWLPYATPPDVPACITAAHQPFAVVTLAHAAPVTVITLEDECP